jgi:predicted cation transporter
MNTPSAIVILVLLFFGPLMFEFIECNIEAYFFVLGLTCVVLVGILDWHVARKAATEPIPISIAVVAAGLLFGWTRTRFDLVFARLRGRLSRPLLAALAVFIIGLISSCITAIVAALILVETIGLLHLERARQADLAIAGCFSIGLGAALTPVGEPLSTLAASALHLHFFGLFDLLAPYILPGVLMCAVLAGFFARGDYDLASPPIKVQETTLTVVITGAKVFAFVAGLVMISEAFAPLASRYVNRLGSDTLYWANMTSAVLDNATLVALEVHHMELHRAREAIIALLLSGGMLIPGNIPNIITAGALNIRTARWAKLGIPLGLVMLGIYFAALKLLG